MKIIKSEFDKKIVEVLRNTVPGQKMELNEDTTGHNVKWTSMAKEIKGKSVVQVFKDEKLAATDVYDYESGEYDLTYM